MNQETITTLSFASALHLPENEALYRSALTELQGVIYSVYTILSDFHEVSLVSRKAFSDCDTQLRETLSHTRSLRRKDFDQWFEQVKRMHDATETDLRTSVQEFLAEQTELSDKLLREVSSLHSGRAERLAEVNALLADFSRIHAARRDALRTMLADFKAAQVQWQSELKTMLAKAKVIRMQDVKLLFEKFHRDAEQRRLAMKARRAEVAAMLETFRNERLNKLSKS
jgi:FtsZ-binding cell division protein ZapB